MKYEKQLATVLSACLALSVTLTPLAADLPQTDKNSQGNVAAANDQEKNSETGTERKKGGFSRRLAKEWRQQERKVGYCKFA